jgi:DNA-directed RNA polymerase specialized sigma subunit
MAEADLRGPHEVQGLIARGMRLGVLTDAEIAAATAALGQLIADEQAECPYERAAETLTNKARRDALENLSYRERRVFELPYGLGEEHRRTLDGAGRTFNVSRERIRQSTTRRSRGSRPSAWPSSSAKAATSPRTSR